MKKTLNLLLFCGLLGVTANAQNIDDILDESMPAKAATAPTPVTPPVTIANPQQSDTPVALNLSGLGNAKDVANAFLAIYCGSKAEWIKNIELVSDPNALPYGKKLGYSTMVGYYAYLPKTVDDLTKQEKLELLNDPRLLGFIASLRAPVSESPIPKTVSLPKNKPVGPTIPEPSQFGFSASKGNEAPAKPTPVTDQAAEIRRAVGADEILWEPYSDKELLNFTTRSYLPSVKLNAEEALRARPVRYVIFEDFALDNRNGASK